MIVNYPRMKHFESGIDIIFSILQPACIFVNQSTKIQYRLYDKVFGYLNITSDHLQYDLTLSQNKYQAQ